MLPELYPKITHHMLRDIHTISPWTRPFSLSTVQKVMKLSLYSKISPPCSKIRYASWNCSCKAVSLPTVCANVTFFFSWGIVLRDGHAKKSPPCWLLRSLEGFRGTSALSRPNRRVGGFLVFLPPLWWCNRFLHSICCFSVWTKKTGRGSRSQEELRAEGERRGTGEEGGSGAAGKTQERAA